MIVANPRIKTRRGVYTRWGMPTSASAERWHRDYRRHHPVISSYLDTSIAFTRYHHEYIYSRNWQTLTNYGDE